MTGVDESLNDQCAREANPGDDARRPAPACGRSRPARRLAVALAVLVVAALVAFAADAQTAATKGLSGPTLRLFKAVELNDMAAVKASLDDGADLSKQNDDGQTAPDLAVDMGHFIIAHYLLSRRLLGRTEPVVLAPDKMAAAKPPAKPRPAFQPPPEKPTPPAKVAAAKPEAPAAPAVKPAPAPVSEKPVPPPAAAEAPLATRSITDFFKSLVDLVTPGGERPAELAAKTPAAKPAPAAAAPGKAPAEAAAKKPAQEPDEIVVEISPPPPAATGEMIEEIKPIPPAKLEDKDLETVTAEPAPAKQAAKPAAKEAKAAPKEKAAKPAPETKKPEKQKEEKKAPGIVDRLADLFRADKTADQGEQKPDRAAAAAPKPAPAAPPPAETAPPGAAAKAPPPPAPAKGAGPAVASYDLPLPAPSPEAPRKFTPRFLDRLAEFLESGDEAAFKAWMPEMQIMTPAAPAAAEKPGEGKPAAPGAAPAKVVIATGEPEVSALDALESDLAGIAGEGPPTVMAAAPAAAPAAVAAAEKPGAIKGAFNKLMGALGAKPEGDGKAGRTVLAPDEKLAAAGPPAAGSKAWPVTEVEAAKTRPIAMAGRMPDSLLKTSLTGVTLTIGQSVSLENSYAPGNGADPTNQCVKKNRGTTLFCLEPVDWPDRVQADFLVPTILYTGHKAIARYDQGIASRLHALFPTDAFPRVVAYFSGRYGKPTDAWNRSIAPFAKPRQDNPTLAWRSVDPKTGAVSVLEIRKYDDTRGGFPDTNRGAVMLYFANSPPIFPQVSTHELMRLTRISMGAPGQQPEAAPADAAGGANGPAPDLSLPEPSPEPAANPKPGAAAPAPAAQPNDAPKTEKQLKDEARAKRRAEREAKRAAGAAKQAAGAAKKEIGAKRATPAPPSDALDLPPETKP